MNIKVLSDQNLLKRIAQDDQKAFRNLFDRYKSRFYAAALKMTHSSNEAEEIVQEVFCTLWQRRYNLQDAEKPTSYLFTIVYNAISHHFKKLAAEKSMKEKVWEKTKKADNYTEQTVLEKESRQWLQNIINQLPSQQQLIYKLSKEDGLSRQEIAEQLHISPNTVKNHLLKAMQFIRAHWSEAFLLVVWWFF